MKKIFEGITLWLVILTLIALIYGQLSNGSILGERTNEITFSQFLNYVDNHQVSRVNVKTDEVTGRLKSGEKFHTNAFIYNQLIDNLYKHGVIINVNTGESFLGILGGMLLSWLPMIFIVGVWIFFMRQLQAGSNKTMSFGRSKARLFAPSQNKITFDDIAGIEEAKEELIEIVDFLKSPHRFQLLGGKIPKGCLLMGPPGSGKTLLAKAIAGEAGVPFFSISGSDFVEMFVGVGASRVRDMFQQARKNAPCVLFIDEIDAVGKQRGISLGGGNDEREQTLNQLLVEMDGFTHNEGVIVIAATNRPDVLDNALLRPGRFDRRIVINLPDIKGREGILRIHTKKIPLAPDIDIQIVARSTPGFSGADLANLVNEAALIAARREKKVVTRDDIEYARDKVMMGTERRSLIMKEEEKLLTAYHEAGHAIIAIFMPASDPIHKATIIPRGRTLGLVMRLPEDDRVSMTREKIIADITVAMGGRIAEELIFGYDKVTSGASSDIAYATKLTKAMVMQWGMSSKLGPIYHDEERRETIAENTANLIDDEVQKIIAMCQEKTRKILTKHIEKLHLLADHLMRFETLTGEEIQDLLAGKFTSKIKDKEENKKHKKSSLPIYEESKA